MKVTLLSVVPEDPEAIADLLSEHGPVEGLGGYTDPEEIAEFLSSRAGQTLEAELDTDDPIGAAEDIAKLLSAAGLRHWATFDAFAEPSRGLRVQGRSYVNHTGEPGDARELEIPWTHGEPSMDERTLMAGGLTREQADAVCAAFFDPPAPAPGR